MFIFNFSVQPIVLTGSLLQRLIDANVPQDPDFPSDIGSGSTEICFTEIAAYNVLVGRIKDPSDKDNNTPFLKVKLANGLRTADFTYHKINFPGQAEFVFYDVPHLIHNQFGERTSFEIDATASLPAEIPDKKLKSLKYFPLNYYYRSVLDVLRKTIQERDVNNSQKATFQ